MLNKVVGVSWKHRQLDGIFLPFRASIRNIRAITGGVCTYSDDAFGMTAVVSVWRESYVSRGLTFTLQEVENFWAWG